MSLARSLARWPFILACEQRLTLLRPVPTDGPHRPLLRCLHLVCPCLPIPGTVTRGVVRAGTSELPLSLCHSPLPQLHKHTLLTNVVKLPCHFHLIMVMTQRRGAALTGEIQSKLISLAGDGNGTPLLAVPRSPHTLGTAGCPGEWEQRPFPLCREELLAQASVASMKGPGSEGAEQGRVPCPSELPAILPAGCCSKESEGKEDTSARHMAVHFHHSYLYPHSALLPKAGTLGRTPSEHPMTVPARPSYCVTALLLGNLLGFSCPEFSYFL